MDYDRKRLSKTLAHALRHAPDEYGIELDERGWADVRRLLEALADRRRAWEGLSRRDLRRLIRRSDKDRFELEGDRIRARYGHSVPGKVDRPRRRPPETLYHGTTPDAARSILESGLQPRGRQYVHLSPDVPSAREVGHRRTERPTILRVNARQAHDAGLSFYRGGSDVWLADRVPAEHIDPLEGA